MTKPSSPTSRIARERDFHNRRFTLENRDSQHKYYQVVTECFDDYRRQVECYARAADVLEYGCATGEHSLKLTASRSVTGIDISDVAIAQANARAAGTNHGNRRFLTMNAEAMEFADGSFDLVFGSGIIHHLNPGRSFREISRVLRPQGTAVFIEPLGHNPLINLYRRLTPRSRTMDERPLRRADFRIAQDQFAEVELAFYGLLAIAATPLIRFPVGAPVLRLLRAVDRHLLRVPGLQWHAWFAVATCHKERSEPV